MFSGSILLRKNADLGKIRTKLCNIAVKNIAADPKRLAHLNVPRKVINEKTFLGIQMICVQQIAIDRGIGLGKLYLAGNHKAVKLFKDGDFIKLVSQFFIEIGKQIHRAILFHIFNKLRDPFDFGTMADPILIKTIEILVQTRRKLRFDLSFVILVLQTP